MARPHDNLKAARGICNAVLYTLALLGVLAMVLVGCGDGSARQALTATTPMVRANGGASSALSVTVCATTAAGGNILQDMLNTLAQQGLLVSATDNAQARLTLNACPFAPDAAVIRAAAEAARAAGGTRR
jgi:hypothetical protein